MNQKDVEFESQVLVEFYKRLLRCLNVEIADMFFFSNIMGKGEVLDRPGYLDQAWRIGISLINYTMGRQGAATDAQKKGTPLRFYVVARACCAMNPRI